jgi:hypothetical protein
LLILDRLITIEVVLNSVLVSNVLNAEYEVITHYCFKSEIVKTEGTFRTTGVVLNHSFLKCVGVFRVFILSCLDLIQNLLSEKFSFRF